MKEDWAKPTVANNGETRGRYFMRSLREEYP